MRTGRLLDVLSSHEAPVRGLVFFPTNVSYLFFNCYHLHKLMSCYPL